MSRDTQHRRGGSQCGRTAESAAGKERPGPQSSPRLRKRETAPLQERTARLRSSGENCTDVTLTPSEGTRPSKRRRRSNPTECSPPTRRSQMYIPPSTEAVAIVSAPVPRARPHTTRGRAGPSWGGGGGLTRLGGEEGPASPRSPPLQDAEGHPQDTPQGQQVRPATPRQRHRCQGQGLGDEAQAALRQHRAVLPGRTPPVQRDSALPARGEHVAVGVPGCSQRRAPHLDNVKARPPAAPAAGRGPEPPRLRGARGLPQEGNPARGAHGAVVQARRRGSGHGRALPSPPPGPLPRRGAPPPALKAR